MKERVLIRTLILFLVWGFLISPATQANPKDKDRWNKKYDSESYLFGKHPIKFLYDHTHLLPKGRVLDIAMGEGRNGVYLAAQGFDVIGLDISEEGLKKAEHLARENNVTIETRVVDLETVQLKKSAFDVIICSYYMQRDLFSQMKAALKSGGMVLVETYNIDYLKYNAHFKTEWALNENELLNSFQDFKILRYQSVDDGKLAYSSILAQKP